MIAYLEGSIVLAHADYAIVQTAAGVGYQVHVPGRILPKAGEVVRLYVHTHAREGELTLYGFSNFSEKLLFEMLLKTSGVGPKLGLAVLSTFSAAQLVQVIQAKDVRRLQAIPGIGQKTAAKLCMDMVDHLKRHPLGGLEVPPEAPGILQSRHVVDDLISALVNMGFPERDVLAILTQVKNPQASFEEQLKKALMLLTSVR